MHCATLYVICVCVSVVYPAQSLISHAHYVEKVKGESLLSAVSCQLSAHAKATIAINTHIHNRVRDIEERNFLARRWWLEHTIVTNIATFGRCHPRGKRVREGIRWAAGSHWGVCKGSNNRVTGHLNTLR